MTPVDRRLLASGRLAAVSLAAAVVLGAVAAALAVGQAWLLARAISGAFLDGEGPAGLVLPLGALAAVLAARAGLAWAAEVVAQRISCAVKSDLRRRLLARAVALGPRWASDAHSGEVALLATRGLDALDGYFARYLPQLALAVIVPIVVVVSLAAVDVVAAMTVLLTVPLIPVFMVLVGRMSEARRRRRWAALSRLARRFLDVVTGLPTLRAYGRADAQVGILRLATEAYRVETMATLRIAFLSAFVLELLATISVALVAVGIALRLVVGELGLETGLFALVLAPEAYLPLRRLGAEFHASEEGVTAAARAFDIIDAPLPVGGTHAVPAIAANGDPGGQSPDAGRPWRLVVDGIRVVQPGRDVAAPDGASFAVGPGEIVAVVGPSGAGKSTLVLVILGLLRPSAGRVEVVGSDGIRANVTDLDGESWRRRVAWVPQAPFLFAGTVAENVRLAAPDVGEAAVRGALADVGLGDLDPSLVLGEGGSGVSSGQRRRIGVARALLRHASILLLDEPTAGLDATAEAAVLDAVRAAARGGAAVILVAHRPAAAAIAGRVVEVSWSSIAGEGEGEDPGRASVTGPREPGPGR